MKLKMLEFKEALSKSMRGIGRRADHIQLTCEGGKLCISAMAPSMSIFTAVDYEGEDESFDINVKASLLQSTIGKFYGDNLYLTKLDNIIRLNTEPGVNYAQMELSCSATISKPDSKKDANFDTVISTDKIQQFTAEALHATDTSGKDMKMASFFIEDTDDAIRITALDGKRISIRDTIGDAKVQASIILPAHELNDAVKLISGKVKIAIASDKKFVRITGKNIAIVMSAISGSYYNVQQILSSQAVDPIEVLVATQSLINACDLARLIDEKVVFDIKDKTMSIYSNTQMGKTKADLAITTDIGDKTLKIGFNCTFIIDALRAINADMVKMTFGNATSPCVMTSGDTVTEIVMPVRI